VKISFVVGISGGEYGIRGFIDAYDRRHRETQVALLTLSGPGSQGMTVGKAIMEDRKARPHGSPAFMIQLRPAFLATGNPSPSNRGEAVRRQSLQQTLCFALKALIPES